MSNTIEFDRNQFGRSTGSGSWLEPGSDAHKRAFCRMLLDTHNPYKPAVIDWPVLAPDARARLTGLPIWDIAVQVEGRASLRVKSFAGMIRDPLLRQAVDLNAFEEARHKEVLSRLVAAYGITLAPEPFYAVPADAEWAFMVTGFSECIDSFFAFGLFALAKRSGFFPAELVDTFEPVIQEECRHILFFVNWVAWHRRNLPWWRRPIFLARIAAAWLYLIGERISTIKSASSGGDDSFTINGRDAIATKVSLGEMIDVCLAENERRMATLDPRLLRPRFVPRLAKLIRAFVK